MARDIECPFCGEWQEINHDGGYGYSEDTIYEQECCNCEKTFGYSTVISLSYEAHNIACLNTGQHEFKPSFTVPVECTMMECACGARRKPTEDELRAVMVKRGYECKEAS